MWIFQLIPPIGNALLVIVPSLVKMKKYPFVSILFIVIAVIMAATTSYLIISDKNEISGLQSEISTLRNLEQKQSIDLKEIRAAQGDQRAYEAYQNAIMALNRQWAKISADQLKENLLDIEREAAIQKQTVEGVNKILSSDLRTKWFPAVDKILATIDAELEIIGGGRPYTQESEMPHLSSTNFNPPRHMIRKYLFHDGAQLIVIENPAIIDQGNLRKELGIYVNFAKPKQGYRPLVGFRFSENTYWFSAHDPIKIDGYQASNGESPITDPIYFEKIKEGIRQAVIHVLREVPKK